MFCDTAISVRQAAVDLVGKYALKSETLFLRYYDDLSYAEIAGVLDIKLGTVMSRLSRARTRLLGELGEDDAFRPGV